MSNSGREGGERIIARTKLKKLKVGNGWREGGERFRATSNLKVGDGGEGAQ